MRNMRECLVCQNHKSRHDSLATLVSGKSLESMLTYFGPSALEIYSRDAIIGIFSEYQTP
jgi:hypothetical protein